MSLVRIPEPCELMDDHEQAEAYARADFSEANGLFLALLARILGDEPLPGPVLDLGCGPADIPLRLARDHPGSEFHLLDGSEAMLEHARHAWTTAGLAHRARFLCTVLPLDPPPLTDYGAVISNSLLHHLTAPRALWDTVLGHSSPGAPILVMDLMRPASEVALSLLLERYAADAPPVLRRDFGNSLRAAYTVVEVRSQLAEAGLAHLRVAAVSDRHLAVAGRACTR